MSQENVEIVRRVYEAFNQRRRDVLAELLEREFLSYPNPDDPEQGARKGYDENVAFIETQWKALPGLHTEIEEAIGAGNDVVALVRHTARVPGSDSQIDRHEAHLWSLREGRVVSLREFATREQAIEAAGLRE